MITDKEQQIIEKELWGYGVYWYAIDKEGYVIQFMTSGDGPVPLVCLPLLDAYDAFTTYLDEGNIHNDIVLYTTRKGIYCYAYEQVELYLMRGLPASPVRVSDLPSEYHSLLRTVTFSDLKISETPSIDIVSMHIPNSWGYGWIPPS